MMVWLRNSADSVSEESAIDAFSQGIRYRDLKSKPARSKPRTVGHLMDIANKYADGEESLLYKMRPAGQPVADSPKAEDRSDPRRRNGKGRTKKRKGGGRADPAELVAAEFPGQRGFPNLRSDGPRKQGRPWQPRKDQAGP